MNPRTLVNVFLADGVSGLAEYRRDWSQERQDRRYLMSLFHPELTASGSSVSDADLYPAFCRTAAHDEALFRRFRKSLIYRRILEHVSEKQGSDYLKEISEQGAVSKSLPDICASDDIGTPRKFEYGDLGMVSPTTLRYAKVASDLERLFGPLDGMDIAEVGVGYGGQCRVVTSVWDVGSYTLYDLPEVLALAKSFLGETHADSSRLIEVDGRDPLPGRFDLAVSNYAFSELRRDVQEMYMERVIEPSERGYVTYNAISPPDWNSLTAEDFMARIPGARALQERPLTHVDNVIVVWGATN